MRLCSNVPAQRAVKPALADLDATRYLFEPGGRVYEQRRACMRSKPVSASSRERFAAIRLPFVGGRLVAMPAHLLDRFWVDRLFIAVIILVEQLVGHTAQLGARQHRKQVPAEVERLLERAVFTHGKGQ